MAPRASPREAAVGIAHELRDHGYTAYFAGGCVRDRLLGLHPKDYDVATSARPEEITQLFPRTFGVGASFGVILVKFMGNTIEVTTFRAEGVYSDHRHPDAIEYADAEKDARRRDFTINGLFEDPFTGAIVDYVGGEKDLARGIIRAIDDPAARLGEDQLRALRAVRFAARFGFQIEPATAKAIDGSAAKLRGVSRERIGQEVEWMLTHATRAAAAALMQDHKLDAVVLDESHRGSSLLHLARLPDEATFPTALAAWWLDRWGAAQTPDQSDPSQWGRALILSNNDAKTLCDTLETFAALRDTWPGLAVAAKKKLAARDVAETALALLAVTRSDDAAEIRREIAHLATSGLQPEPFVDGRDLIELGLPPGPAFGRILSELYDAQLEGRVTSRREALALAPQLADSG